MPLWCLSLKIVKICVFILLLVVNNYLITSQFMMSNIAVNFHVDLTVFFTSIVTQNLTRKRYTLQVEHLKAIFNTQFDGGRT